MPIPLRVDFDAPRLRAIARGTKDAAQTRRLAIIYLTKVDASASVVATDRKRGPWRSISQTRFSQTRVRRGST
jgi:hypothetical protein